MPRDTPRLGRGLKSLMSIPAIGEDNDVANTLDQPPARRSAPVTLPVERIVPNPHQPRKQFDPARLTELARSLTSAGMIQPVVVREQAGRYELIAGQRRWAAAKLAGLHEIPVLVRDASDEQMLRLALIENIHREDLNAIERAEAYRAYAERFGRSPEEMGAELGEDRTTITNYIRLLSLPEEVRALVSGGQLTMGHARSLLGLADPQEQTALARSVLDEFLSVRQLEELVRTRKAVREQGTAEASGRQPGRAVRPHILDLQERLSLAVGTKVLIQEGRTRNTGRISVEYYNLDDFDRIAKRLGLDPE